MSKKRKKKEAVDQLRHAQRRLEQRYGVLMCTDEIAALGNDQIAGQSRCGRGSMRLTISRSVHPVTLPDGRLAWALWDKRRHTIVTFYTDEMVAQNFGDELVTKARQERVA